MTQPDNLQLALDYIKAVETRTSFDQVIAFYHPEAIQVEYPNAITKNTATRTVQDLKDASERGQKVLQKETYEIINSHSLGNTVILETIWRGTLAIPLGAIPVGGEMKAYFAQFFEFQDGKIIRQRNYDCFEPFS